MHLKADLTLACLHAFDLERQPPRFFLTGRGGSVGTLSMLVTVQFPLFDVRLFDLQQLHRLRKPDWSRLAADKDYVKGFGGVRRREIEGFVGHFAEDTYCSAHNAIRFPKTTIPSQPSPIAHANLSSERPIPVSIDYRGYFSDGGPMSRVEIGLKVDDKHLRHIGQVDLNSLLSRLLSIEVIINGHQEAPISLALAGELISLATQKATTHRKDQALNPPRYLFPLQPFVIVAVDRRSERTKFAPSDTCKIYSETIEIVCGDLSRSLPSVRIEQLTYQGSQLARNLRLLINRAHADLEISSLGFKTIERVAEERIKAGGRYELRPIVAAVLRSRDRRMEELLVRIGRAVIAIGIVQINNSREAGVMFLESIWPRRITNLEDQIARLIERFDADVAFLNQAKHPGAEGYRSSVAKASSIENIFLSYRRDEAEILAGRIYDTLLREVTPHVFLDSMSLKPGEKWKDVVEERIANSTAVLVLVSKNWSGSLGNGRYRIEKPKDPVRKEVEIALRHKKLIIPIVLPEASFPPQKLPHSIREIANFHALKLGEAEFYRPSIDRLIEAIRTQNVNLR